MSDDEPTNVQPTAPIEGTKLVLGRPVELKANETFRVTIDLPPLSCARCGNAIPDRLASFVWPPTSRAPGQLTAGFCTMHVFCSPCATLVVEGSNAGAMCHHGWPHCDGPCPTCTRPDKPPADGEAV